MRSELNHRKKCTICDKTQDDLQLEYHSSEWWHTNMGIGAYFCPGCHKTQHRMEKKFMREQAKELLDS